MLVLGQSWQIRVHEARTRTRSFSGARLCFDTGSDTSFTAPIICFNAGKMRSSVTTATMPPRKPTSRGFAVRAETQQPADESETHRAPDHEHDFFWTYTEEPHRTRRMAIIKAHPEVRVVAQRSVDGAPLIGRCR
jgi:hypothetical protein